MYLTEEKAKKFCAETQTTFVTSRPSPTGHGHSFSKQHLGYKLYTRSTFKADPVFFFTATKKSRYVLFTPSAFSEITEKVLAKFVEKNEKISDLSKGHLGALERVRQLEFKNDDLRNTLRKAKQHWLVRFAFWVHRLG